MMVIISRLRALLTARDDRTPWTATRSQHGRFGFAGDSADGGGASAAPAGQLQPAPFIPPKFPTTGAHDDGLIKPSEYLKSIGGSGGGVSCAGPDGNEELAARFANSPLHRTKSELSVAVQQHQQQPLAAISIHDLHSVQLKKTPGTVKIMPGHHANNNNNFDKQSGKTMYNIMLCCCCCNRYPRGRKKYLFNKHNKSK